MLCFKATAIKRHKITVTKFYFQGQIFITLAFEGKQKIPYCIDFYQTHLAE